MTVNLSYFAGAGWQFFDNNGTPLSGGKIYTYLAGTTTPAVTYTTVSGAIANSNPIILDAAGRPTEEVWLTEGISYKFVVKNSADVTSRTYDNLGSINDFSQFANTTDPALGDALIGFRQSDNAGNLAGSVGRTVHQKFQEIVSVKDFGAVGDGVTDDSAAFNAAWAYIKSTFSAVGYSVDVTLNVPNGTYYINSSVNWSNLTLAWNISVDLRGSTIIAGSGCAGYPVIDATAVRGINWEGGFIESNLSTALAPSCGVLLGQSGTTTCGNNSFQNLKINGVYTLAPFINIGSETTSYFNCYFMQQSTDVATYAYIGDGANSRAAVKSLYTTFRANGTLVSFTNNSFYNCHFRHYKNGSAVYLRGTANWMFDSGCYFLAFDKSNIEAYMSSTQRNTDLRINGLFETTQSPGVKYLITFIVPDGQTSAGVGFCLTANSPHASIGLLNMVNEAGTATTGSLKLTQAYIQNSGKYATPLMFNKCDNLTISGEIRSRDSTMLNLYDIKNFIGVIYTTDGSLISGTPGANKYSYILFDETTYAGQVLAIGKGPNHYLGVQNDYGTGPALRGEGTGADLNIYLVPKGTGKVAFGTVTANADAPVTGYITILDSSGTPRKLALIS